MARKKHSDTHGRKANSPGEIPKQGWKDIAVRVKNQISKDNVNIISAGISYYAFLAIFPAIAAIIAIYGLVTDQQTIQKQLNALANVLPPQSSELIQQQLTQIVQGSPTALGWGLAISIVLSIWSANRGTKALFQGINIAYNEEDQRSFIKGNAITLLFTFLGIITVIISMALVVAFPAIIGSLNLPAATGFLVQTARWILLLAVIIISLGVIYRYAPDRENPKWRWVSWGSVAGTVLWVAGSLLFSFYISNFGDYNATYGSLAAVVILLLWFYLSAFSIMLGAEINSEIEHQTKRDTTSGKNKPMGKRGAHDADDLGKAA